MADVNELQDALSAPAPTQRQIIETWLALQEAQKAAEQAARAAEATARRAELASKNQVRIHEALLSEVGRLIQQAALSQAALREFQEELAQWAERFDYRQGLVMAALRMRLAGSAVDKALIDEIERAELDFVETEEVGLRRRLMIHRSNLSNLQIQAAGYGASSAPLYLLNQITNEEQHVEELETRIDEIMKSR